MVANSWSAAHDNPTSKHQIARELAAKGHRVLWIEGSGMRSPNVRSGADRSRIVRKLVSAMLPPRRVVSTLVTESSWSRPAPRPVSSSDRGAAFAQDLRRATEGTPAPASDGGVWALSPLFLPLPALGPVRALNGFLCMVAAFFWGTLLGMKQPTLIVYPPIFAACIKLWPYKSLYHCVDRWDAFTTYDASLMRELDRACCQNATVVIASARELLERCKTYTVHSHLVMHGVDWAHFRQALTLRTQPRPNDLPEGAIVGFFGLLSEWVDQDLLLDIAQAIGTGTLILIGKADVDVSRLGNVSNIRLLGPKPFSELPHYAAFFDVGLIPFHVNELTRAVNPIKLREMLAAGCPVVSTALPEVESCRDASDDSVSIVWGATEFIAAVQRQLALSTDQARRAVISERAKTETWSAKVDEILRIVDGVKA